MSDFEYEIPNDPDVTPGDIDQNADLSDANLSEADLRGADLSGAKLNGANLRDAKFFTTDLSDTNFRGADLSGANLNEATLREAIFFGVDLSGVPLHGADLRGADLQGADLSGAHLQGADLSDADLSGADLSDAHLHGANFSNTYMLEADLSGAVLSRGTNIDASKKRTQAEAEAMNEKEYDKVARANHELRVAYSANGLIGRARTARVRERVARRKEAYAEKGLRGKAAWLSSVFSHVFTGYGIRLRWVLLMMILLYFGSAFVYWEIGGMTSVDSLYYSVVTFTTSPPAQPEPTGLVMRIVAGVETFAGTVAIIFLGYVLGTRERV